ncbi:UNVERIFIED_ORG: glycosyltransferase family 2 protein [Shinella sp. XGS7]|nr:glycosyltransferase family A protein [Shinella sp. XGS7]
MTRLQDPSDRPLLSILIKALNEERRIAACLDSVMAATRGIQAEVILVDSLSNDRTVEIARGYPIRIVQFAQVEDRGCGAAVQLGYQEAHGDFIYVLDADMQLDPGFLPLALKALEDDPGLAGVGGRLVDQALHTQAAVRRAHVARAQQIDIDVPQLGGGGLYRRKAIEQVGYLANRWLSAYEEADLGARLRAAGWRLRRLRAVAVSHEGHHESDGAMLRRLWRNGRAQAGGVFLRSAWGKPWWGLAARNQHHVLLNGAIWLLSVVAAMAAVLVGVGWPGALACLIVGPVLLGASLMLKKRSLSEGSWAWLAWQMSTLAAILGWQRRPSDPRCPIEFRVLTSLEPTRK